MPLNRALHFASRKLSASRLSMARPANKAVCREIPLRKVLVAQEVGAAHMTVSALLVKCVDLCRVTLNRPPVSYRLLQSVIL